MATLREVAAFANVSEATVSLVLNNRPGPKQETRERVRSAATALHYVPNAHARNLAAKTTDTIGLLVTSIDNPFFGSVTSHINRLLSKRGYSMVLAVSDDDIEEETRAITTLFNRGVKGLLVIPTQISRSDFGVFEHIQSSGISTVFVTSYYQNLPWKRVLTDYEAGSFELTRYLLDLGHRDIRFLVSSDPALPIYFERVRGFNRAYSEYGLTPADDAIVPCPTPEYYSGQVVASRLLKSARPDAVVAINDVLALGALHAARELGIRVPQDLSIGGYDDVVFASIAEVPLTTVRQRIGDICRIAVDMLIDSEERYPEEVRVSPELVVRTSTGKRRSQQ